MKNSIYTLILVVGFTTISCKSIEKLVDRGDYDGAIELAAKRLAGKKNKKTKHVRALERGFNLVNQQDLERIDYLKSKGDPKDWAEIYVIGLSIDRRQELIRPFIPLISKNGYEAHFSLINTKPIVLQAREGAAKDHYNTGQQLLAQAKTQGDKRMARLAFQEFEAIGRYFSHYHDVSAKMDSAHDLGTMHILVKAIGNVDPGMKEFFDQVIPSHIDKFWIQYHDSFEEGLAFDAISTLEIDDVYVSPERERSNQFVETKSIENWVDLIDESGQNVLDSLGNVIQVQEIEEVNAVIQEIIRNKTALISGHIETRDYLTGRLMQRQPIESTIEFISESCQIQGDRRALNEGTRKRLNNILLSFPTDFEMIQDGFANISDLWYNHLYRIEAI